MGLLLAEGRKLKHFKEKRHHEIPHHDLSFCGERPRSRRYGRNATLRLLVQPYHEDNNNNNNNNNNNYYYYYHHHHHYCPFPSNGAPVE
jgi:hypothetical protein